MKNLSKTMEPVNSGKEFDHPQGQDAIHHRMCGPVHSDPEQSKSVPESLLVNVIHCDIIKLKKSLVYPWNIQN